VHAKIAAKTLARQPEACSIARM